MGVGALEILTGAGCLDILGVETGVDEALAVSAFGAGKDLGVDNASACVLYTSPSPRES